MARYMEFPLSFKRLYSGPLDSDTYVETKADLDNIKTKANSYVGMMVSCREDGLVYILGTDMEFTPLGGRSVSIDFMTTAELDNMFGEIVVLPYVSE